MKCIKKYMLFMTGKSGHFYFGLTEPNILIDMGRMYDKLVMYKKGMKVMSEITYDTE